MLSKEEVLSIIEESKKDGGVIQNGMTVVKNQREVLEYIKSTKDQDAVVELISFNNIYAGLPYISKMISIPDRSSGKSEEQAQKERLNLIGRVVLTDPKVIEVPGVLISNSDLNYIKENFKSCIGQNPTDDKIAKIDQGIALNRQRKQLEENRAKEREAKLKSSQINNVCSCHFERDDRRSSALYANPHGSLSYAPSSSKSQRCR